MLIRTLSSIFVLAMCVELHAAEPAAPDYRRDVEPIFKKYCSGCHNANDREGKLSLESFDDLLRGGAGGVALVPGRVEQSRLLLVLNGGADPKMPPEGNEAPTAAEVAVLKNWIAAGAKGPTGKAPDPTILLTPKVPPTVTPRDAISAVALSPTTGGPAAIASYGAVRLIDVDDRSTRLTLTGLRGPVADVEFSTDGKRLVTAAGEPGVFGEAQLWNLADGKLLKTFTAHRDSLYAVALSPDGKTLATGNYDQTIKLWDAATGKELRTLTGYNGAVFDVAFHPGGKILAGASADRTIKLWNVATGARLDTLGQPTKDQFAVAFSPDGKTLLAGGADNRLRAWRISANAAENTNPLTVTRYAHEGPVLKLVYSTDGKTIVSTGEDRFVRIWDAATLTERRALERQPDWAPGLALSHDGKLILVGRMDGSYAFYDAATGKLIPAAKPELAGVSPRGIERGKPTVVTLTGKYLAGAASASLRNASGKPVSAQLRRLPESKSATSPQWEIIPDAKLPRGSYQLVVPGESGESNAATLVVDDLPQIAETEPNDAVVHSMMSKDDSPPSVGYWGVCSQMGDVDHFPFALKAGDSFVCRLDAKAFGSTLDGTLTLLDPSGEVIASVNDFENDRDPLLAYRVPQAGTYTVRVRDQLLGGSANHFYRLTAGTFPLVTGVFPPSATIGRETKLELTGFNLPAKSSVAVKPTVAGDSAVAIDESFRTAKPLTVRAVAEDELVEREPNDEPTKATPIPTPGYVVGRILASEKQTGPDVDLFRFESKKGQSWIIETEAARRGSPLDTKLEVLDAAGRPVPRVLLQAVRDSYVTFRSINSTEDDVRLFNWEEMQLEQYLYFSGEVTKLFRMPQGPDSGFRLYLSAGKRRNYFDTSAAARALDEPAYIVEPHPIGTKLVNNGLPVYTLNYVNDDDGLRKLGSDSRLTFTAPADGAFLVRVTDVRGFGGDRFHYRLTIREPQPDFVVKLNQTAPTIARGSGLGLTFNVERIDGFEDEIEITAAGLPEGYTLSTPTRIQAGHDSALAVLNVAAEAKSVAPEQWAKVQLTAKAEIAGSPTERPIAGFKSVTVVDKPKILVTLEPSVLTIAPGATISAKLKIERNGFKDRVAFNVFNLPHGVIVDNIGLNGILIPEGQTEREIFLTCYEWVPETERAFFAQTTAARGASAAEFEASRPVQLQVRKPSPLARGPAK